MCPAMSMLSTYWLHSGQNTITCLVYRYDIEASRTPIIHRPALMGLIETGAALVTWIVVEGDDPFVDDVVDESVDELFPLVPLVEPVETPTLGVLRSLLFMLEDLVA